MTSLRQRVAHLEYEVRREDMIRMRNEGMSLGEIGLRFGITRDYVGKIIKGRERSSPAIVCECLKDRKTLQRRWRTWFIYCPWCGKRAERGEVQP